MAKGDGFDSSNRLQCDMFVNPGLAFLPGLNRHKIVLVVGLTFRTCIDWCWGQFDDFLKKDPSFWFGLSSFLNGDLSQTSSLVNFRLLVHLSITWLCTHTHTHAHAHSLFLFLFLFLSFAGSLVLFCSHISNIHVHSHTLYGYTLTHTITHTHICTSPMEEMIISGWLAAADLWNQQKEIFFKKSQHHLRALKIEFFWSKLRLLGLFVFQQHHIKSENLIWSIFASS